MEVPEREKFAREWLDGWMQRDLERILSHYSDDIVFQSPLALHLRGESSRTITGKKDLKEYFEQVLNAVPGKIEFEFLTLFHGVDSVIVHFQSPQFKCAEFMELNRQDKVCRAAAHAQVR